MGAICNNFRVMTQGLAPEKKKYDPSSFIICTSIIFFFSWEQALDCDYDMELHHLAFLTTQAPDVLFQVAAIM